MYQCLTQVGIPQETSVQPCLRGRLSVVSKLLERLVSTYLQSAHLLSLYQSTYHVRPPSYEWLMSVDQGDVVLLDLSTTTSCFDDLHLHLASTATFLIGFSHISLDVTRRHPLRVWCPSGVCSRGSAVPCLHS
jgi:hypothetical protein